MNVEHPGGALGLASNVPLHQDSSRLRSIGLDHQILNLNVASGSRLANTEHWLGVVLVLEVRVASSHDEGPNLANDADTGRNVDSIGKNVGTMVKVNDLVGGNVVKYSLNSSGVICDTI